MEMKGFHIRGIDRVKSRKEKAQALVEFAIVLPLLLVTVFVLIELARVFHAWAAIENGARFGIRYAVTGEYDPSNCNNGAANGECLDPADELEARIESIHQAAWAGSTSVVRVDEDERTPVEVSYFNVLVCDPDTLIRPAFTFDSHSCVPENPGDPGERVIVLIEFNHPLLTPILSNVWPQLRLTAQREAIVESFRIPLTGGNPNPIDTPTSVPSRTPPPSPTLPPPPNCSKISVSKKMDWDPDYKDLELQFKVVNASDVDAYLVTAEFKTNNIKGSPPARLKRLEFAGDSFFSGADIFGPSYYHKAENLHIGLGAHDDEWWEAEFRDVTQAIEGNFHAKLEFRFEGYPNVGPCQIVQNTVKPVPPTHTPKPTKTPKNTSTPGSPPSKTPTKTPGPQEPTSTPFVTDTPKPPSD
jgi:hypothetical protein